MREHGCLVDGVCDRIADTDDRLQWSWFGAGSLSQEDGGDEVNEEDSQRRNEVNEGKRSGLSSFVSVRSAPPL
jgi:hypothetical protein